MRLTVETADGGAVDVSLSTVEEVGLDQVCIIPKGQAPEGYDCESHEHEPKGDTPVLAISNGSGHVYVIEGDLGAFVRSVVDAIHSPVTGGTGGWHVPAADRERKS